MNFKGALIFTGFCLTLLGHIGCTKCQGPEDPKGTGSADHMKSSRKIFSQSRTADPKTLDPQAQFDSASGMFINSVYDKLISYHYLKRPYEMTPLLLKTMPTLSSDKKTYSFELKTGIKFKDDECFKNGLGRELTSADVVYTIKRFADSKINNRSWFLLENTVIGLDEFRQKSKTSKANFDYDSHRVAGLEIVDRYRFKIHLVKENPLTLYAFTASPLSIIAREAVEKYGRDFARNPVGTGPYRLEKYRKKQTMILTKNPNYFEKYPTESSVEDREKGLLDDAGKQLPLLDEIHIHYIPEPQPGMLKFKKGGLDWIGLDRDNFSQMAHRDEKGQLRLNAELRKKYDMYVEPGFFSSYMPINQKDKLLGKNKNLRLAIAHAIDVKKGIELLANGRGIKMNGIVPLAISDSEKSIGQYGFEYDLDKAKNYLKKAGYPGGKNLPPIEMLISGTSTRDRNQFEFFRNSLDKIGIKLTPEYKTWSSWLKATERGDFQITMSAWAADYPDPENFYMLFYGPNKPPGQNSSAFDNSEYNKLYEKMRYMESGPKRRKLITQMAKILQAEVPVIFYSNPILTGLTQKWTLNFKRNVMPVGFHKYLNIDQPAKIKFAER